MRISSPSIVTDTYSVSSTFGTRGMTGNDSVAEIIAYNNIPTATTIDTTESYLALKYGITLDQTSARNYTLSDGSTAWDATTAGIYKKDIAGIAQDNISTLYQKKSQSINNPNDITVETGSIMADRVTFVWGNNGSATGTTTAVSAIAGMSRISRAWKIEENNGDIGTVKISYPSSVISTLFSTPVLLISTNGTFTA